MKIALHFVFLSILLLSVSCSKTPGKTGANFKLKLGAVIDFGSAGAGGAMLWGKSNTGDIFGVVVQNTATTQLELNNGSWTFWAVAWEGNGSVYNFLGKHRCAKTTAKFSGGDASVQIDLANETCADADFSPEVSTDVGEVKFPDISYYDCDKLSDHQGLGCGKKINGAKSTSRRLMMASFKKFQGEPLSIEGSALVSACRATGEAFQDEHLPVGNGNIPAVTVLQSFFSATNCNETDPKGFVKDVYQFGLLGTVTNNSKVFINGGTCNLSSLNMEGCSLFGGVRSATCVGIPTASAFKISKAACESYGGDYTPISNKRLQLITSIPDEVLCSGKRIDISNISPNRFAGGMGTELSPFRVCTEAQLNAISGNYLTSHFALNADLDMNKTSIFNGAASAPFCMPFTDPGMNFNPIGGLYDEANNCTVMTASQFSGSFEGNNHTVANIRISSSADKVGFIRFGGRIQNLVLKNIDVEGNNYIGAFSGYGAGQLINLKVIEGDIRGKNYVGAIAGFYNSALGLIDLHVTKAQVEINDANAYGGGLVGTSDGLANLGISNSSFEGLINVNGNSSIVGGLIGFSYNAYVDQSYSSGVIITQGGSSIGGLIGFSPGAATINSSYSRMGIGPKSYWSSGSGGFGGLVGKTSGVVQVDSSYYYGSIMLPCNLNSLLECKVGVFVGDGSVAGTNKFGAILTDVWHSTLYAGSMSASDFDTVQLPKTTLLASGNTLYKNSGSAYPRLNWETSKCSLPENTQAVAAQAAASSRGTFVNPVVICTKEQFLAINNFPALHYILEDNINLGTIFTPINIFSGTLRGQGHIISGFHISVASATGGLIHTNQGRISDVKFANGFIFAATGSSMAGVVGLNSPAGVIEGSDFLSVNFENTGADFVGVISAKNQGKIFHNRVSADMNISKTSGFITGKNDGANAVITGNRVDGVMKIIANGTAYYFGGIAGINYGGKISEVEVNTTIENSSNGNTSASTMIGTAIGYNLFGGVVEDILITPRANLVIGAPTPTYGSVFGKLDAASVVKRIVAANEVAIPYNITPTQIKSFTGSEGGTISYMNSFFLKNSVFQLGQSPISFGGCMNVSASVVTYSFSTPYNNASDGFYLSSGSHDLVSKRIVGIKSGNNQSYTVSPADSDSDFLIPCLFANGASVTPITNQVDFININVHSIGQQSLKTLSNYCPSSASVSAGNKSTAICDFGLEEFDIVENRPLGFGSARLIDAYKTLLTTKLVPGNRPIWTLDPKDEYPRLFLAD
jgi:hypothetical protein